MKSPLNCEKSPNAKKPLKNLKLKTKFEVINDYDMVDGVDRQ